MRICQFILPPPKNPWGGQKISWGGHLPPPRHSNDVPEIDLSLSSPDCMLEFTHPVVNFLRGSDHYPIILKLITECNYYIPIQKYKVENADCQLTSTIPESNSDYIDEQVNVLCSTLLYSADQTISSTNSLCSKIHVS